MLETLRVQGKQSSERILLSKFSIEKLFLIICVIVAKKRPTASTEIMLMRFFMKNFENIFWSTAPPSQDAQAG